MYKRIIKGILPVMLSAILLVGCGSSAEASGAYTTSSGAGDASAAETSASTQSGEVVTNLPQIDNTKWQYNSDDNVYYQIGISYCETPADESYETLSIFVPGDYMNATDNGDGTYTCEINTEATVGSYTAETAPMVLPVNTRDMQHRMLLLSTRALPIILIRESFMFTQAAEVVTREHLPE